MKSSLWIFWPAITLSLAGCSNNSATSDIQGTWKVTGGEQQGKPIPFREIEGTTLTFQGKNFALRKNGQVVDGLEGMFTIDPSKNPREIDLKATGAGKTMLGIFEIQGDTLKWVSNQPGLGRPVGFSTADTKETVTRLDFRKEKE